MHAKSRLSTWITIAIAALALAACSGDSPPDYEGLTLTEFLDRAEEALTRDGEVLHILSVPEDAGPGLPVYQHETWLALDASEARFTSKLFNRQRGVPREPGVTIANGNDLWVTVGDGASRSLPLDLFPCLAIGASPLVEFFACLQLFVLSQEDQRHVLETNVKYEGRPAVAVLTIFTVTDRATGEVSNPERRLFFDATTLLPLAVTKNLDEGRPTGGLEEVIRYETEFVSRDSLPADFFDPASIGWVEGAE
jgi:hypothetical protein